MSYAPPLPPPYGTPPAQYGPPIRPPRKRPWWKATWALIAAGAVVGLIIGAAAGGGSKEKTKTVAGPTKTATVAGPTTTVTATARVTTTPTKVVATHTRVVRITYTPPVKVAFSDGTYRVGSEIKPGTYHTNPGGNDCYWERDAKGSGLDAIIENDNITGPTTIDINASDYAFKSSGGCDWVRVG
ncbi:MAG TPA: hypothetical protein VE441_11060 [Mycobacterium sp.]|nr:hypothetical protein [Mycobacterium sp.]